METPLSDTSARRANTAERARFGLGRPASAVSALLAVILLCLGAAIVSMPNAGAQEIDTPTARLQFDSGFKHSCAVSDGSVECWGSNMFGQLGTDEVEFSSTPIAVTGVTDAIAVTAGLFSSCAVRETGAVVCWGDNRGGELGDGTTIRRTNPQPVIGVADATAVSLGRQHGCALLTDKTVKCWGTNWDGRVGDGTDVTRLSAVAVSGLTGAIQVSAGANHSCARLETGSVQCWGGNFEGQLGAGDLGEFNLTPVAVIGVSDAIDISAHDHSCVVLANGDVQCWGQNRHGQIGDGTRLDRSTPVDVALASAVAVSAGYDVTCAVLTTGAVSCWGSNNNGETGNRSPSEEEPVPTVAIGVSGVAMVNAASGYTCAVQTDSSVRCWGFNRFGQLGNQTEVDSLTPVLVGGESLMALSNVTCVNGDGVITVELMNPTAAARTYLVMFNNTTRGGTVGSQSTVTQTIGGLVDTTITVTVTDTSAVPGLTVLDVPEQISCDPGMGGTTAVNCVDGNGVITLTVDNPTSTALIYLASFNNTRRAGLVAANGSAIQTIGGLVDATFTVTLVDRTAEPDVEVYNEQVAVLCDSGGPDALTATAATTCVGDTGVITFTLSNTAPVPISYLVSVNNTRRSGTLAPGATTNRSPCSVTAVGRMH